MIRKLIDIIFGEYQTKPVPKFGQSHGQKPRTNGLPTDKDVQTIGGKAFVHDDEDKDVQDGVAEFAYVAKTFRELATGKLYPGEAELLLDRGLDIEKGALIKEQKANGATQVEASEKLTEIHGRGFSVSTVARYWPLLGTSHTTTGGGASAEGMQKHANNA